jgi:hypothetical protein
MERSQMKNIVVLKNLPSNLIEEAFVIFKSSSTLKSLKYTDIKENLNKGEKATSKDYLVKEAEMIISNYIDTTENKGKNKVNANIKRKYKWLKIYGVIITIAFIIAVIL